MRLKNVTIIPKEKIKQYVEFCKPFPLTGVKVFVRYARKGSHGYALIRSKEICIYIKQKTEGHYPVVWNNVMKTKRIALRYDLYNEEKTKWETRERWKRVSTGKRTGYIKHLALSREEELIQIIAHELRHLWQYKRRPKCLWAWGTRGKRTNAALETDADAYGIRKMREWRRLKTGNTDALDLSYQLWNQYKESSFVISDRFPVNKSHCKYRLILEKKAGDSECEWTLECFKNEFFLCLSRVIVTNQDNHINDDENGLGFLGDRKYYIQARNLMYWIPITRPSVLIPPFVINLSDLTTRLKSEFRQFCELNEKREITMLLKEIAARFFENINYEYTHESVLSCLKVAVIK